MSKTKPMNRPHLRIVRNNPNVTRVRIGPFEDDGDEEAYYDALTDRIYDTFYSGDSEELEKAYRELREYTFQCTRLDNIRIIK